MVAGMVQGVGFRPFIFTLAQERHLRGFVKNQTGQVLIEAEGLPNELDRFMKDIIGCAPALARIVRLNWKRVPLRNERNFRIDPSDSGSHEQIFICPDAATCPECLGELMDPNDRRFLYPFLNCTNCGPRLTIVQGAPYDRARTTMAPFNLCIECRHEYEHPDNRRFHAQPTACPICGPHLTLVDDNGFEVATEDPVRDFAQAILAGRIGAIKGLGGFHLVCDAANRDAVHCLRRRKERDEKPFAIMVADLSCAEELCEIGPEERQLLESRRAPIVLLRLRQDPSLTRPALPAREIAPDNPHLGLMLPYTPLHHLLFRELPGTRLVMTSGNRSDEPISHTNESALEQLRGIADLFLVHDRPIQIRCDDSVTRVVAGMELPVRRSRGYAPEPVRLPFNCPAAILALGGQLKSTFALGVGEQAFLSHHLGDLDEMESFEAFRRDLQLYQELFQFQPECLVHDPHPDYASTQFALEYEAQGRRKITRLTVQHHHAHLASCMAENHLTEPVIGVVFDGAGLGSDGAIWGGEFLTGDYAGFHRAAHFRYVAMPGGEQAIRQPWRMGLAHMHDAGLDWVPGTSRIPPTNLEMVKQMIVRHFNAPWTSSAGRLFDAVASLAGIRDAITYEGQAAMELEWLALEVAPDGFYPCAIAEVTVKRGAGVVNPKSWSIDTRPMIRAVIADVENGTPAAMIARRFHSALVEVIAEICLRIRRATWLQSVVLSGGVFMNALLLEETLERLEKERFRVHRHRLVPPNDGGLSLGQLAIAANLTNQNRSPDHVVTRDSLMENTRSF
jgi:hydrogenase maturation protein HypF